jgi:pimeloyl-ACP methyl ester carboxylesterase
VLGCLRRGVSSERLWARARAWLIQTLIPALIPTLGLALLCGAPAAAEPAWHRPVKVVADSHMTVTTAAGSGAIPIYVSPQWSHPLPEIRRVIIVMHGVGRDAIGYLRGAEIARAEAGPYGRATLLIVPQFLADIDIETYHLPPVMLRWSADAWSGGEPAHGPAPLSTFDVFDALLQRLADRALLPELTEVVVAGHSAGGQVVQRYAIVGRGGAALAARGITPRYVVANPSSYLYFSDDRPMKINPAACPEFDRWKYGLAGAPRYVGDATGLEQRYATRNVIYLLGTADTNPFEPALDKSCGGEAQGPYRLARGEAYFAYMQTRHPDQLAQRVVLVPDVAHSGARMFGSVCGLAVLFDRPGCPGFAAASAASKPHN